MGRRTLDQFYNVVELAKIVNGLQRLVYEPIHGPRVVSIEIPAGRLVFGTPFEQTNPCGHWIEMSLGVLEWIAKSEPEMVCRVICNALIKEIYRLACELQDAPVEE